MQQVGRSWCSNGCLSLCLHFPGIQQRSEVKVEISVLALQDLSAHLVSTAAYKLFWEHMPSHLLLCVGNE